MEGSSVSLRSQHETAGDESSVIILRRERMIEMNAPTGVKDRHIAKCTVHIVVTMTIASIAPLGTHIKN